MRSSAILCADCGCRPCLCLEDFVLLRRAVRLLGEVAEGRADVAAAAGWLERHRQSETEEAAIIHARRELTRIGQRGIANAMEFVAGLYPVQQAQDVGGSDQQIKATMERRSYRVRLEHVAVARRIVAQGWLGRRHRGPVGVPCVRRAAGGGR